MTWLAKPWPHAHLQYMYKDYKQTSEWKLPRIQTVGGVKWNNCKPIMGMTYRETLTGVK